MTKKITMICESCKSKVEECEFASYEMTIEGKDYLFCCKICADRFLSERKIRENEVERHEQGRT
ncbi:MAG: hypothetical protein SVM80_01550 [Halobacteriota archaeon]|nr:hypothetical protein [Halobacteriota archaeon]